jgi:hypothetical protein
MCKLGKTKEFPSIIEDMIIKETYLYNLLYVQIKSTEKIDLPLH